MNLPPQTILLSTTKERNQYVDKAVGHHRSKIRGDDG